MSDSNPVALEVVEDQKQDSLTLGDLRIGYVVGLTKEGNFVFEVVGQDQGLVELLGLHKYAELKVKSIADTNQNIGDKLVLDLTKALALLTQQIARLVENKRNNLK